MAGNIQFRNDRHAPFPRETLQSAHFRQRESAVAVQLRECRAGEGKRLVVGEMQMKIADFVEAAEDHGLLERLEPVRMARQVQHQTAIGRPGQSWSCWSRNSRPWVDVHQTFRVSIRPCPFSVVW